MSEGNAVHPWQQPSSTATHDIGSEEPRYTIVMPAFNQAARVAEIIRALERTATLPHDFVFIDDASDDRTHQVAEEALVASGSGLLCRFALIRNPVPLYETACDNQGFRTSRTEVIIEVQSDIEIRERGFDQLFIRALNLKGVGTVSGRMVHNFSHFERHTAWKKYPLRRRLLNQFPSWEGVGRMGDRVFETEIVQQDGVYLGETGARGPWCLRKSDLDRLGYLDETHFFLGNDDHDFHRRLYEENRRLVAYLPIQFRCVEADGSTRRERTGVNKQVYEHLKATKQGSEGYHSFLAKYRPYQFPRRRRFDFGIFETPPSDRPITAREGFSE